MAVDFGRIFSASFKYPLRKDAYLVIFAVQLIFAMLSWLITGLFAGELFTSEGLPVPGNLIQVLIYVVPVWIAGFIATTFLMPMYMENASFFFKAKRKRLLETLETSKKRFIPLLVLTVVFGLIALACFGGLLLVMAGTSLSETSPSNLALVAAGGLWFLVGLVVGAIVIFMTSMSGFFCVLEKTKPIESLKKSWNLVGKNKLNTFIFFVLLIIIYVAIAIIGALPESVFIILAGQPQTLSVPGFAFMVIRTIVYAYLFLFLVSAGTSYYLSIKKSKD